jgi:hypothetical protein
MPYVEFERGTGVSEKKYQIFISSTFSDLEEARDKVSKVILGLHHFPIGMEMFSAGDLEQWEVIRDTINVSDYYVLIIGQRYGSLAADGVSYTEKEYDYAKAQGIPILAFIQDQNIPTAPSDREHEPEKVERLKSFIAKAKSNKMCDFWKNYDELSTKVAIALPKSFARSPRQGWARGGGISPEVMEELASLSKENRALKDELDLLRSRDRTLPELFVTVGDESEINLEIKVDSKECFPAQELPRKERWQELSTYIRIYVKPNDVDAYNEKIPSEEEFEHFRAEYAWYKYVLENAHFLKLGVLSRGQCKANDISIEIYFPDFVKVYEFDEWRSRKEPEIEFPRSLDLLADRRAEQSRGSLLFADIFSSPHTGSAGLSSIPKITSPFSESKFSISGRTIELKLKSLLHKRSFSLDDEIVVVPLSQKTGEVIIKVICEEVSEEVVQKLTINAK